MTVDEIQDFLRHKMPMQVKFLVKALKLEIVFAQHESKEPSILLTAKSEFLDHQTEAPMPRSASEIEILTFVEMACLEAVVELTRQYTNLKYEQLAE